MNVSWARATKARILARSLGSLGMMPESGNTSPRNSITWSEPETMVPSNDGLSGVHGVPPYRTTGTWSYCECLCFGREMNTHQAVRRIDLLVVPLRLRAWVEVDLVGNVVAFCFLECELRTMSVLGALQEESAYS